MPLEKIEVPLILSGGIDTKTERKLVPDQKMLVTENVDFSEVGALRKSKGLTQLTNSTSTSDDIDDVSSSIFSHNNEIVVLGKTGTSDIYSYNEHSDVWESKGGGSFSTPLNSEFRTNSVDFQNCGSSSSYNLPTAGFSVNASVILDSDGAKRIVVTKIDYETGSKKVATPWANEDVYEIKIAAHDDATDPVIYLMFSQLRTGASSTDNDIYILVLDKDLEQVGTERRVSTFSSATPIYPCFDCILVERVGIGTFDFALFFVACTDKTKLEIGYVDYNSGLAGDTTRTPIDDAQINDAVTWLFWNKANITSCYDGNSIYIAYCEYDNILGDRDVYIFAVDADDPSVGVKSMEKAINSSTYPYIHYRIDLLPHPSGALDTFILTTTSVDFISGSENYTLTHVYNVDYTGSNPVTTQLTANTPLSGCEISSKGLSVSGITDEFYYFVVTFNIDLQLSTYSLIRFKLNGTTDIDKSIVGKFFVNLAADPYTEDYGAYFSTTQYYYAYMSNLEKITLNEDGKYDIQCIVKGDFIGGTTRPFYTTRSVMAAFDIREKTSGISYTRLSNSTHFAGSVVREYDGIGLRYSGFQRVPYFTFASSTDTPLLDDGAHTYLAIFKYYDKNGEIHFSGISEIYSFSTSSQSVVITQNPIAQYEVNQERDSTSFIEIYRTLTGTSGPYYLVGKMYNDDATFSDVYTDAVISSNEQVYTSGGVLEHTTIPALYYITSGLDRLFGISADDRNKVYYSQKRIVGSAIGWSEGFLFFRIDGNGNSLRKGVGIEIIDDKIIILKEDSILFVSGDGPLPTGEQNTFTDPVIVSQQVGCSERQSIVVTPIGIMFKSLKGIYIVDRSLNVNYIGAPVEEYNSEQINQSCVSTKRNEVYFQTDNRMMIYNYLQNKWSTNTYLKGKSCCIWNDNLSILKSDGYVYYQNDAVYTDNGNNISMKVATPWYKLKGISGFGRLYEIVVLGEYKSDHTLNVRVYYDYDDTDYDDYTFDVTSINIYEFSVKPSRQKCQAFKVEIWDTPTGGSGESLGLTGISVRLGVKKGFFKLSDSNKG